MLLVQCPKLKVQLLFRGQCAFPEFDWKVMLDKHKPSFCRSKKATSSLLQIH